MSQPEARLAQAIADLDGSVKWLRLTIWLLSLALIIECAALIVVAVTR